MGTIEEELHMSVDEEDDDRRRNAIIGFALVCGAGLSTALGASLVFFPKLVQLTSKYTLASSLGMSSGVMLYVSFTEIYRKSEDAFEDAGYSEDVAFIISSCCFFGGAIFMILLDIFVHQLANPSHSHSDDHVHQHVIPSSKFEATRVADATSSTKENVEVETLGAEILPCVHDHDVTPILVDHAPTLESRRDNEVDGEYVSHCVGCSADPANELEKWKKKAGDEIQGKDNDNTAAAGDIHVSTSSSDGDEKRSSDENVITLTSQHAEPLAENETKLMKMGMNTAFAIALHNFPEGLATFVAAQDNPSVGAVLAIAIGIHNIPEGVCVALPIYYSTGDSIKAFSWALLSGVSEPIAALLGWTILASSFTDVMYGVLFGMVSGMMVMITLKELIPTAHRYDKDDKVVTYSLIVGMGIMSLSLCLFRI